MKRILYSDHKNQMIRASIFISAIWLSNLCIGQSIIGRWVSVDDETGKDRSIVELRRSSNGTLSGTIVKIFPEPGDDPDPICDKCDGAEKNKPILGMRIINGMSEKSGVWSGGTILDPESGKTYDCKIWEEDGSLMVRGYLLFFYRTQEWRRE